LVFWVPYRPREPASREFIASLPGMHATLMDS